MRSRPVMAETFVKHVTERLLASSNALSPIGEVISGASVTGEAGVVSSFSSFRLDPANRS